WKAIILPLDHRSEYNTTDKSPPYECKPKPARKLSKNLGRAGCLPSSRLSIRELLGLWLFAAGKLARTIFLVTMRLKSHILELFKKRESLDNCAKTVIFGDESTDLVGAHPSLALCGRVRLQLNFTC